MTVTDAAGDVNVGPLGAIIPAALVPLSGAALQKRLAGYELISAAVGETASNPVVAAAAIRHPRHQPCHAEGGIVCRVGFDVVTGPDWEADAFDVILPRGFKVAAEACGACFAPSKKSRHYRGPNHGRGTPALARRTRQPTSDPEFDALLAADELGPVPAREVRCLRLELDAQSPGIYIRCPDCVDALRWFYVTWDAAVAVLGNPMSHSV